MVQIVHIIKNRKSNVLVVRKRETGDKIVGEVGVQVDMCVC